MSYTATFLSTRDWICGLKSPADMQGLVWFTDGSGMEEGTEAEVYGHRTRLFLSLGKRYIN